MSDREAEVEVEEAVEELTTKILRCETLAARAREQSGFAPEVVRYVVQDLCTRRDSLLGELKRAVPRLWERHHEVRARRDEVAQKVAALEFQLDERELRVAIGEIEATAAEPEAKGALSEAELQLARLQEQSTRLAERLASCERLGDWEVDEVADPAEVPMPEAEEEGAAPEIVVYEGTPEEHRIPLVNDQLHIGRGRHNDVQLRGDAKISRNHLRVFRQDDAWWVTDHNCANGTLVNGELIAGPRRLFGGEEIIVGETFLRFVNG